MKVLLVNDKDYTKAKKLLMDNGIQAELEREVPLLRQSNAKPDETPTAFSGIWANDERTLESIRAKAWPKRK